MKNKKQTHRIQGDIPNRDKDKNKTLLRKQQRKEKESMRTEKA
jgi:hypothetical protein